MSISETIYVWTYRVKPEAVEGFARAYGHDGEWARFFACSPAFLGTELARDEADPARFATIDRFADGASRAALVSAHRAEYDAIDARWAAATEEETFLGAFVIER